MKPLLPALLLGLGISTASITPAAAYPVDCAILLCLAGGWPASTECAHARTVFIARITPWPVEPPLQIWNCPMRASFRGEAKPIERLFDIAVTFRMTEGPITFYDTKEGGLVSVRVASSMDVPRTGRIENGYGGINEAETWGKNAPWCDYSGLADGEHTFEVRATGPTGNSDPTPASYTWTIDTVAPDTTITAHPDDPSSSANASLSFTSTETWSTFECRLDGSTFSACTSPWTYTGLNYGIHTFEVRAIDAVGNTDPTPASYTWTIHRQIFLPIVVN